MTVHGGANPKHFEEAVNSMLKQTVLPEQFVISVDGKLTDEHEKIIENVENIYPNIFTVIYNEKAGNWHAANAGLLACRNEFIARMDSDDISEPSRCEKELLEFENNELDMVGSYANEFVGDVSNTISVRKVPLKYEDIVKYGRRRNPFNHPSLMYRKSKALECGGYSNMKRCEDYDFAVKMIMARAKCKNISESLLNYRLSLDTYSRRKNWDNTKALIYVRFINCKRGFSSFWDFLYTSVLQVFLYVMPVHVTKWFYQRVLRK